MRLDKDILEIIKDIQDINEQMNTKEPNKIKLQIINEKAKIKFPKETAMCEFEISAFSGNSSLIPIDAAPIRLLLDRLPIYRNLYINELRKKCEKTTYLEILREYKI